MNGPATRVVLLAAMLVAAPPALAAGPGNPPQGRQSDKDFAASYDAFNVTNVSATTQQVSCYTPEVEYSAALGPDQGYLDGGMSACKHGQATTGEDLGPYPTQDVTNTPMRVKDHS